MHIEEMTGFALSPQQERIFALDPKGLVTPFLAEMRLTVEGAVDQQRLRDALCSVVRRHEIFRTGFATYPGLKAPLQVVKPETASCMDDLDSRLQQAARAYDPGRLAVYPVDLAAGQPLRCIMASSKPGTNELWLTCPAVCADAATLGNLARELVDAYSDTGTSNEPLQYADLAEHLNEVLQSDAGALARQYWHPRLVALKPPAVRSSLPSSHGAVDFRPRAVSSQLGRDALTNARLSSRSDYASNEVFFLACWQVLLGKVTGDRDFTIGYAADGHERAEFHNCMGPLEKYVPLNCTVAEQQSFREVLQRAGETVREAVQWQKYFQWPEPEQFLPVCFSFYDGGWSFHGDGMSLRCSGVNVCSDRFELKLSCTFFGSMVSVVLWYDPAVYVEAEAQQLLDQYLVLALGAVASPDAPLSQLTAVGEEERRNLVHEYNESAPKGRTDHASLEDQIEKQAAKTPKAAALADERSQLTYEDLNGRSNRLAHYLKQHNVGPESRVAVCMERSFDLVVALLAVLKAGAAYVPLEPNLPQDRLAFMIKDSGAGWVLSQEHLLPRLPQDGIKVLALDREWEKIAECSDSAPRLSASEQNLAYVIYTSGSSGLPKGVAITRGGLNNYARWACNAYGCEQGGTAPLCSSIGFDLTVTALWPVLASGGCVVLAPEKEGVEALARQQHYHQLVKITPAHLRMLEQLLAPEREAIAARFVIGGEQLRWEQLQYWRRHAGLRIVNEYGPTETTVGSCVFETREWQDEGAVPIGRAIVNTQVYVLNQHGDLTPTGAAGELYIGGSGLARGYLNRPDLTAEYFVPNPFSASEGERLYRTGDLVRWRVGRELEYLGRLDNQVKIRGYRIELGEVESVLEQHHQVAQAAVVVHEPEPGEKRMAGYVVKKGTVPLDMTELRAFLAERLPEYMVPAALMELEHIPTTANGKVDRNALPYPDQQAAASQSSGPKTPTEELVASIWEQVLKRDGISRDASFFELGGHSLLATQVVSRVRNIFDVDLPLRTLFEKPTVAGLAEEINSIRSSGTEFRPVAIRRGPSEGPAPLSFAQERLWFIDQMEPGTIAYNIMFGLRLRGELNSNALHRSLNAIVRRHQILHTCFPAQDGVPVQKLLAEFALPLEQSDLRQLPEDQRKAEVAKHAREVLQRPFDLSSGPLLRARLLQTGELEHVLVVSLHHIISDGWSTGIVARELGALYEAYAAGREPVLPEPKIQYADYARWQREWLKGEVLEKQMEYWTRQLAGMQVLQLPVDSVPGDGSPQKGAILVFLLEQDLTTKMKDLCRREGVTMFMALLAAFQVVLGSYTGRNDIAVGTDIANRNYEEIEGLIGFFVNQLVMRVELSDEMTFTDLLKRVRQITFEAYQHQDAPFAQVVEKLTRRRSLDTNPLFGIKFVFQNAPGEDMVMPGLQIETLEFEQNVAKFDLMLTVSLEDDVLSGVIEYRKDLFSQNTMRLIQSQFRQTLAEIVARPEIPLPELKQKLEAARQSHRASRRAELKQTASRELLSAKRR